VVEHGGDWRRMDTKAHRARLPPDIAVIQL
jgi:hypothetical protein